MTAPRPAVAASAPVRRRSVVSATFASGPSWPRTDGPPASGSQTLGIVLYHDDIVAGLVDLDGNLTRQVWWHDATWLTVDDITRTVRALSMELLGRTGTPFDRAVLGFPLSWDQQRGHVPLQHDRATASSWFTADLPRVLQEELGVPVLIENRCRLSALAEHAVGASAGHADAVFLQLVGGSNTAVIVNGGLVRGTDGYAGEISHLHVPGRAAPCRCGARGCLGVTVPSADQLLELHRADVPPATHRYDVLGLAAQQHRSLRQDLEQLGQVYGEALAAPCLILNPSVLVVDGLLGLAAGPVAAGLTRSLEQRLPDRVLDGLTVKVGALGVEAPLLGAAVLAATASP